MASIRNLPLRQRIVVIIMIISAAALVLFGGVLLTYDFYDLAEAAAVRAITGEASISGRLPIGLPGMFPVGHGLDR